MTGPTPDENEVLRIETAAALRDLARAFVDHEMGDGVLLEIRDWPRGRITSIDPLPSAGRCPRRERMPVRL
jgi:hypothetical protein